MAETDTTKAVDTMSGSDALLWTISSDPVMRPTIVALLVFSSTPEWHEVRARVAALTEAVPRLRSTVVNRAPGRGRPRFVPDGAFDLDVHLRRMRLPDYSGLREVLDLAQTMATRGFDPALPLWEAVLVEGADPASGALVMKVHHSLIDGVGGLTVLAHLFDAPGGTRAAPRLEQVPEALGGRSPLWRLGDLPDAVRLVDDTMDAVFHPLRSVGRLAALGASVGRLMAPTGRPLSPIMTGRSVRRHADVFDLDLETVKQAAKAWGGTLNDVFVASVVRGLALYHEQHGVVSVGFRALMPVNVRAPGDPTGGNHFVPARFVISTHAAVAESIAEVRRVADEWKNAPGLAMSDVLATALSALPAAIARSLWGSMLLGNDVCVTNIPGPPTAVTVVGAAVQGIYAVSPPSGAALSVSLISVANRVCVTVTADVAAVPDSPKLAGCIEDGFAEVCSVRSSGRPQGQ